MENEILDDQFNLDQPAIKTVEEVKQINLLKIDANENIQNIRYGRYALFFLSAFVLIATLFQSQALPEDVSLEDVIIEGIVLFGIYLTCAIIVPRRPKLAFIIALSVYTLVILLSALVDVTYIFRGFVIKVAVYFYLGRSLQAAIRLGENLVQLRSMGVPFEEIELAKKLKDIPKTVITPS